MGAAEGLIWLVTAYGGIGLVVAVVFLLVGLDRIDEDARGSYAFRPLLIPGLVILWPVVLVRWWELERARYTKDHKPSGS